MAQNPLGGFLKGLFGRQTPNPAAQAPVQAPMPRPQAEAQALGVSEQVRGSDAPVTAQPTPLSPQRSPATPTTEAYMTRKKGRKLHRDSYADAKALREHPTPGRLPPGTWPRSSAWPGAPWPITSTGWWPRSTLNASAAGGASGTR